MSGTAADKADDRDILLRQAVSEIRALRSQLNVLRAQEFVVEAFHAALLGRSGGGAMGPDLCWQIERLLQGKDVVE